MMYHFVGGVERSGLILIQQGKGGEGGASCGAGASQTVFGSGGGWNFFSKMTALLATIFFVTSVSLAVTAKNKTVIEDFSIPALESVPVETLQETDLPELTSDESDIPQ